jgi:hypothetical protein
MKRLLRRLLLPILVDAWENPKITELVKKTVLRIAAEVHIEVDGNKPLTDVELLSLEIQHLQLSRDNYE